MSMVLLRRRFLDRLAGFVVSAGGIAVIVAILAIFFFIFREVTPLFTTPTARLLTRFTLPTVPPAQGPLYIGMDDSKTIAYVLSLDGVRFMDLTTGVAIPIDKPDQIAEARMTAVAQGGVGSTRYVAATENGMILPFKMGVTTRFSDEGERIRRPLFRVARSFRLSSEHLTVLAYRAGTTGQGLAAVTGLDSLGDGPGEAIVV